MDLPAPIEARCNQGWDRQGDLFDRSRHAVPLGVTLTAFLPLERELKQWLPSRPVASPLPLDSQGFRF